MTVNLKAMPREGYTETLEDAVENSDASVAFESSGLETTAPFSLLDLSDGISAFGNTTYYQSKLGSTFSYPTGIKVPVIYINTTIGSSGEGVFGIDQLVFFCSSAKQYFVVDTLSIDLYAAPFGETVADYAMKTAREIHRSQNME